MARWAALINKRRSEGTAFLVDTGDFCRIYRGDEQEFEDKYLFSALKYLKYDFVGIGEKDIQYGRKRLFTAAKKAKLPLSSANIFDKRANKPLAQKYLIRECGGTRTFLGRRGALRVGMFSVVLPDLVYSIDQIAKDFYKVEKPQLAALETVSLLKNKDCDLIVAISHQGWQKSLDLAREVPGIDIVINGHRAHRTTHQEWVGKTLVVDTGENRSSFTEISVSFGGDSLVVSAADVQPATLTIKEDQTLASMNKEYEREKKRRIVEEFNENK